MPLYSYQASSPQGTRYSGYRFGASTEGLYTSLKDEGLLLIDCAESNEERFIPRISKKLFGTRFSSIPQPLLIDFCHHMAQLDEAGVPLDVALHDLALSTTHHHFRALLHMIHEDVRVGLSLSEALGRHPYVFDRTFQKLISTAEHVGDFAPQFRHIETHLLQREAMSHQLRKSLRTPIILFGLLLILLLVVIDFIIPNMTNLLDSLGLKELPFATRILLFVAPGLAYLPFVILILFGLLVMSYSIPKMRYYLARLASAIPLYNALILNHFWHVLGVMLATGVDLLPSFTQAIQAIPNPYLRDHFTILLNEVTQGAQLSEVFEEETTFVTPLVLRFLKLSEQTGRIKDLIPQAAAYHQRQSYRQLETLVSWLEPVLTLMMGGLMIWIALSAIVPFYEILGSLS